MEIFSTHIAVILEHRAAFAWILLAVFVFFILIYFLGEAISRLAHLAYPDHALLTMSIAARNAALMLAVTMAALPGQPLIYAALIIGMLVEFPHLTALRHVLLGQRQRASPPMDTSDSPLDTATGRSEPQGASQPPHFAARTSVEQVEEGHDLATKFNGDGLIPCITTDAQTGDVLMLGYMNAEVLRLTIETGGQNPRCSG